MRAAAVVKQWGAVRRKMGSPVVSSFPRGKYTSSAGNLEDPFFFSLTRGAD